MKQAPEELEELLSSLPWNQTETCSFSHRQHINILEAKMIQRELKDLVGQSTQPLRCVLLVDSRAAAGAWSKGRSSARNLNRLLRQSLGWTLAGRKLLHLVWIRSEGNPADYPSRCRRIPQPPVEPSQIAKKVLGPQLDDYRSRRSNREIWRQDKRQDHTQPCDSSAKAPLITEPCAGTENKKSDAVKRPAACAWSFREIFAGKARLTQTFKSRKFCKVLPPFELMKKGKPLASQDILNDVVFNKLCQEASQPRQLWHFGFPCGSFSIMQNMNKGSRASKNPLGDGTLKREKDGNEILHRTLHLCRLLHAHGSFFTLENPLSSFAWKIPKMLLVEKLCSCKSVHLDQCQFKLYIPDSNGKPGLAKKLTKFLGTMPHIEQLGRRCNGEHSHVAVLGGVKVGGRWQKRSQMAGSCPLPLCKAYARIFEKSFR